MNIEEVMSKAKDLESRFLALRSELSYCQLDEDGKSVTKKVNEHFAYVYDNIVTCQGVMGLIQEDLKNHKE